MRLFKRKPARIEPKSSTRASKKRSFRTTFISFCVILLLESVVMQLLTQMPQTYQPTIAGATHEAGGSAATGSVANPSPLPTILSPLSQLAPPVLAAAPAQPEPVAVIFHSPLRSYRLTQYFSGRHPAIDMADPTGTPIYATTVGTVVATGYVLPGGGLMVKVIHPNGYISYYAHMSFIMAKVGQRVDNSVQIGRVGATGWATGPHLHFMLVSNKGVAVNPLALLKD